MTGCLSGGSTIAPISSEEVGLPFAASKQYPMTKWMDTEMLLKMFYTLLFFKMKWKVMLAGELSR